ncbi:MAG TPA: glutaredoxin domain-containing protein [Solirubrobacteraceae bacterium]|jgi:glutaredoxin 3|nr:glutaredoxin domain-containing protein [Solirubrobacteraceae bacterium]
MKRITVYSTDPCAFCTRAKALLKSRGLQFEEINLAKDPAGRVELARRTGMMTFPQVLIDGQLLGGYTEVQRAADNGELDELLAA